jgi:hypothetical protein
MSLEQIVRRQRSAGNSKLNGVRSGFKGRHLVIAELAKQKNL